MTVNKRLKELTKDRKDKRFIESQGKAPIAKTDLRSEENEEGV